MHKDIIFYFKQNFSTTTTFLRFVVISEHVYHSLTFRKTSTTNDKYCSLCGYITYFIEILIVVTLEIQLLDQEECLSDKIQLGLVKQELITLPEHLSGVRVTLSLVLCVCFVDRCLSFCTFSFGHCAVCSFLIYEF